MQDIILQLHTVLNMCKGFEAGYSSASLGNGKMLVVYEDKRYVLELREITNPSENVMDDLKRIWYM